MRSLIAFALAALAGCGVPDGPQRPETPQHAEQSPAAVFAALFSGKS